MSDKVKKTKVLSIDDFTKKISSEKKLKKRIVLCHGVFDLLHLGHIRHFKEAKSYGEILVVSITPDIFVNKGPGRPAFNEKLRAEALSSIKDIDYVMINKTATATDMINRIKPNVYCKGPDYKNYKDDVTGEIKNEIKAVQKCKGKIVYTKSVTFSSSKLINQFSDIHNQAQKNFINKIKKKFTFAEARSLVESLSKMKVLIIGETIIDQYVFCDALGKSGKEPVLVLRDIKTEDYLGGAAAISNHLSTFCKSISLLTMVGEKAEYLGFIKNKLSKNIKLQYLKKKNSPTIIKRRFLDYLSHNKVLGVYKINDDQLTSPEELKLNKNLNKILSKYDLVIVSDYGHGFISKKTASIICNKSKYLALNAQVNAANIGYHGMRNYKNINCVIINEKEIRHELRDKNSKIELLMKKLAKQQKIKNLIVTQGTSGSLLYNLRINKFNKCEAFAKNTVDKIGAGDAMLSLISICLSNNIDKDLSMLISSLAAAHSVETIGNKSMVTKTQTLKTLENTLK